MSSTAVNKVSATQTVFSESLKGNQKKQIMPECYFQKVEEEKTAKIEEQSNNQNKYIEEIRASATNTKRKAIQSVFLESLKREQRKQRRRARSAQKKEEKKKAQREKRRKKYREAKIKEKTNCTKPYCSDLYNSSDSFSVVDSKKLHEKNKYERLNTVTIHSCTIPLSVRSNESLMTCSKTKDTFSSNESSTKSKGTAIRAIYIELEKLTKEEENQRK
jgi:hypothetical protein